jgi:hypothetical protein
MTLPMFLGYPSVTMMGASMGLSQLARAVWLITKGLGERLHPAGAEVSAK